MTGVVYLISNVFEVICELRLERSLRRSIPSEERELS